MRTSRIQKRVYELLCKAATSKFVSPGAGQRELHFVFFRKPDRFLESEKRDGHVAAVHFEKTTLKGGFSSYSPSVTCYQIDKANLRVPAHLVSFIGFCKIRYLVICHPSCIIAVSQWELHVHLCSL